MTVTVLSGAVAATAERLDPWVGEPFSADAASVASAATQLPASDAPAEVLWREESFAFDETGRMTHRRHWVYRILTVAGLEAWSLSEVAFSPWHQARPQVRARVIAPDGTERWLDPARLRELSAEEAGFAGERQLLRARLPVKVGAVIEEEVVRRDVEPYFAAGSSAKHLLVMPVPVRAGRLILEAPEVLPLLFKVRRTSGLEPRREEVGGRVCWTFDYHDLPAADAVESALPPDEPRYPHVAFSTGESWSRVAGTYGKVIDERIASSEGAAVLGWLPRLGGEAQMDRVAELLAGVRGNVRHRRVDLGTASMVPSPPLSTLKRGWGDAKDLATLVTAALRAEGIPAYVALLRAGYGMDIEAELPGLGRFNHALVYLPAAEPVWLDPGDPLGRVGELASDLEGRQALVVSPNTRRLIRTPASRPSDNPTVTTIEVFMADDGPSRIVETSVHQGGADRRQRLVTAQVSAADRRLGYEAYVKAAYRAESLGQVEETELGDVSQPFRLRLEALRAGRAWTAGREGAVAIDLSYLITALPRELLVASSAARQGGFVFHEPFVTEWQYRIQPPDKMRLRALPGNVERALGTGRLTREARVRNGEVQVDVLLDSGPRSITAEEFHRFRAAVQELLEEEALVLWFDR